VESRIAIVTERPAARLTIQVYEPAVVVAVEGKDSIAAAVVCPPGRTERK